MNIKLKKKNIREYIHKKQLLKPFRY